MTLHVDAERLAAARDKVRSQLLAERNASCHWVGELSSSPLATATAISALVLAEQGGTSSGLPAYTPGEEPSRVDEIYRGDLSELIVRSLHWLAEQQNDDGGWGDTDRSLSNIATTMLVQAAFHLTGVPAKTTDLLQRADQYVEKQGGIAALKRRYEGDKTFAVPILANCALADMVAWRKVPALPFELACVPQRWYHHMQLPVVSYAIPALVAIGQAIFYHRRPRNPIVRWIRGLARRRSLAVLEGMQPEGGGFLEATPLTSFVVMSLASIGLSGHRVVRKGVQFLLSSVRTDGSWPIDTNLATWNTSQALLALEWNLGERAGRAKSSPTDEAAGALDWLLSCQTRQRHPFTGSQPGGWSWTNLAGGVPDADDTSAALLALADWQRQWPDNRSSEVRRAAIAGTSWLLDLQNRDGGWPTFCRGWGKLPFDRSSNDITAHALRALHAWRDRLQVASADKELRRRMSLAIGRGLGYVERQQRPDGSWLALWFGNQHHPQEANPVYGTAKMLTMCSQLGRRDDATARRGVDRLVAFQLADGGWGAVGGKGGDIIASSVEETALAVDALLDYWRQDDCVAASVEQGLGWLIEAVEDNRHLEPAPIGFYFAKLWYHERLYPQIFATRTLTRACREMRVGAAVVVVGK